MVRRKYKNSLYRFPNCMTRHFIDSHLDLQPDFRRCQNIAPTNLINPM